MAGKKKGDLRAICQTLAEAMGYELVEAGIEKESAGHYLRVYIDKQGGVSLDDCEAYHRAAQPKLEHIAYDFLEISSPGIDRPLKTQRDFDKHIGQAVSVKLFKAIGKRKAFEGRLIGLEDGEIVIETPEGTALRFPQREVAVARPVICMEAIEMKALEEPERHSGSEDR
ncbi:MAG: ribosome maturation factor RimP [Clostridia bacterium]|nr:ribosome maturation factor RimP [Clostridia bacterium]